MRNSEILATARAMRAEAFTLLADAGVAGALDVVLSQADRGEPVVCEVFALLAADPSTQEELRRRLKAEDGSNGGRKNITLTCSEAVSIC